MQFGLGVLQLPTGQFWAMSIPEFKCALYGYLRAIGGEMPGECGISREEFFAMQQQFPDR